MSDAYELRVQPLIDQLLPIVEAADRGAAACALGAVLAMVIRDAKPQVRDFVLQQVIDALRKDVRRV